MKKISALSLMARVIIILAFLLCFDTLIAMGQGFTSITDSSGHGGISHHLPQFSLGGYFDTVYDINGHPYPLLDIAINDTLRTYGGQELSPSPLVLCSTVGYFHLYLESGCGFATNPAAFQVLCQVCTDLSAFINSTCGSIAMGGTGQYVNIWVRNPSNVGMPSGTLGVATSFMLRPPTTTSAISGIADNTMWETINSGKDAYRNLNSPLFMSGGSTWYSDGTTFFHGMMAFNFGAPWNTSLYDPPAVGQFDMYTVILHEMMHALGFYSNIKYNGLSTIGSNYYTRYDTRLKNFNTTQNLITNIGACNSMYGYSFNPSLTPLSTLSPSYPTAGCGAGYVPFGTFTDHTPSYTVANKYVSGAMTIPVYTPSCFELGSSLSHFSDEWYVPTGFSISPTGPLTNNQYFVMTSSRTPGPYDPISNPGPMTRFPTPEERQALCDMGYSTNSSYGYPSNVNLNYNDYGGTACPGLGVVGFNDGLSSTGTYLYSGYSGYAVNIPTSSLMANDVGAATVSCVQVILGSGTVSSSGGVVTYNSGSTEIGLVLLRYVPLNATGEAGNITYIFVRIYGSTCANNSCNLLVNGEFESSASCGRVNETFQNLGPLSGNAVIDCWASLIDDYTLISRGCTNTWGSCTTNTLFTIPNTCSVPATQTWNYSSSSSLPNDHMVLLNSMYWWGGASLAYNKTIPTIQSRIHSTGLVSGGQYRLNLMAKVPNRFIKAGVSEIGECGLHWNSFMNVPQTIQIGGSISNLPVISSVFGMCNIYDYSPLIVPLGSSVVPANNSWNPVTIDFTYTGSATLENFIIGSIGDATACTSTSPSDVLGDPYNYGVLIDHLELIPIASACNFTLPTTVAGCGGIVCDLSSYVSVSGGTWDGPGIYLNSLGQYCFNASIGLAYSLAHGGTNYITLTYTYYDPISGCLQDAQRAITVTGIGIPIVSISPAGPISLCPGGTVDFTANIAGGALTGMTYYYRWILDGVDFGAPQIPTYTATTGGTYYVNLEVWDYTAGTHCTMAVSNSVIVTNNPNPNPITGPTTVCEFQTINLSSTSGPGTWSTDPLALNINPTTGAATGVSAGTTTVTFTLPTSCFATTPITVYDAPDVPVITGASFAFCTGGSVLLTSTAAGQWYRGGVAISGATGLTYTATLPGVYTVIVSNPNCSTPSLPVTVIENANPVISSTPSSVCVGSSVGLSAAPIPGTWTAPGSSSVLSVTSGGSISGLSAGVETVTYTQTSTGCYTTASITVNPLPATPTVTSAATSFCAGSSLILTSSASGLWYNSTTSTGVTGTTYTATTGGVFTVIVTDGTTGCSSLPSSPLTITMYTVPVAITGPTTICGISSTINLTDAVTDGTWSSSATGIAAVNATSGMVTGVSVGTATITYTMPGNCYVTTTVSVYDLPTTPTVTSATTSFCAGSSLVLSSSAWGEWFNGTASTGVTGTSYTATTGGVYIVIVTDPVSGCQSLPSTPLTITMNPLPAAIAGVGSICGIGSTIALTDATTGGTWSSNDPSIAAVGSTSGIVTGVSFGTTTITYTITATGCYITASLTVTGGVSPISGASSLCQGNSAILSETTVGGTWSTAVVSPVIVALGPSGTSCTASGVTAGTAIITYALLSGCTATLSFTVNPNPIVNAGLDQIICGTTTTGSVTLNGSAIGGTPGYIYLWTPPTDLSSDIVPNPTASPMFTTTYLLTVTDANGCSGSDPVTVFVTLRSTVCDPCHVFDGLSYSLLGSSGIVNANVPPGNYYLPADVDIAGDITFTGAVVMIDDGVAINVRPTSKLTLNKSHLFSCDDGMWKGIILQSDATETGVIKTITNSANISTLIEDALVAISVDHPNKPTGGWPYYINTNNAIFNHNQVGISVTNYTDATSHIASDLYNYEFHIENTVFTSRDFGHYNLGSTTLGVGYFPFAWPGTTGTYGLKTFWNPAFTPYYALSAAYMPHFNILNPSAGGIGINYAGTNCHNGFPANFGIYLDNIGTGNIITPYAGVLIGVHDNSLFSNVAMNLFDTLGAGVCARNANVILRNNTFMCSRNIGDKQPDPIYGGNAGVIAKMEKSGCYRIKVEPDYLTFLGVPVKTFPNEFYDCKVGVYTLNYYNIRGDRSNIYTTQSIADGISSNYGYKLLCNQNYDNVELTNNYAYNVANAILVRTDNPVKQYGSPQQITISKNRLFGRFNSDVSGLHYMDKPITVENTIVYLGGGTPLQVNVDNNYMKNVYNGIYVKNVGPQMVTSFYDSVVNGLDYPGGSKKRQYGIWHQACIVHSHIERCDIQGTNYLNDNWLGIISTNCLNHYVKCNIVSNVGRAFQFENVNTRAYWYYNQMYKSGKGFVLNSAKIGQQGDLVEVCANKWQPSAGFSWYPATPGTFQTWTDGTTLPTASPLYVKNSVPSSDPNANGTFFLGSGGWPKIYGCNTFTGVVTASGNGLVPFLKMEFPCKLTDFKPKEAMEQVARAETDFDGYIPQQLWNDQFAIWQAMLAEDTLGSSSDTLTVFKALAARSRYAWFTDIESALDDGDGKKADDILSRYGMDDLINTSTDATTGVRMGDSKAADHIVNNYIAYYRLYIKHMTNKLDKDDRSKIEAIATDCPITGGAVVYRAQALYDAAYDTIRIFDFGCDYKDLADTGNKSNYNFDGARNAQQYQLFPNPNDGKFVIRQKVADAGLVDAEVYDAVGRVIYKQNIIFTEKESQLLLSDATPGVYLLRLRDVSGQVFTFKFVIP